MIHTLETNRAIKTVFSTPVGILNSVDSPTEVRIISEHPLLKDDLIIFDTRPAESFRVVETIDMRRVSVNPHRVSQTIKLEKHRSYYLFQVS